MSTSDDISIGRLMQAYGLEFLEGKRLLFELKGSYSKNIKVASGKECCNEADIKSLAHNLINEALKEVPPNYRYDSPDYQPSNVNFDNYSLVADKYAEFMWEATEQSGKTVFNYLGSRFHFLRENESAKEKQSPLFSHVSTAIIYTCTVNKSEAVLYLYKKGRRLQFLNFGITEKEEAAIIEKYENNIGKKKRLFKEQKEEWEEAIDKYENFYMKRKNDALPNRMRIYLHLLAEGQTNTEEKYPGENLARVKTYAKTKYIPILMKLFPHLEPID